MLTSDGTASAMALRPRSVADFLDELVGRLRPLGVDVDIWTTPVELPGDATPFDRDTVPREYDQAQVGTWWRQQVAIHRVLTTFRNRFVGKVSPVHLFWGALDLAVTRFSGRLAPPHPGGAPNVGTWVMREAYSHEVSSAGYWPGGGGEGAFYSYAYPAPAGFEAALVNPAEAGWNAEAAEFLVPYTVVRTSSDPAATALAFFESTYVAAADLGGWDRSALERK